MVLTGLDAGVGHPDLNEFLRKLRSTKTYAAMEKIIRDVVGPSGFMEFIRFDHGAVLQKEPGEGARRVVRLVIGNLAVRCCYSRR